MSSWVKVGVKVVCVDASFEGYFPDVLAAGRIYTIARAVSQMGSLRGRYSKSRTGVCLIEIANPHCPEGSFALARFRPLITKTQEQDVALFNALLSTTTIQEDA